MLNCCFCFSYLTKDKKLLVSFFALDFASNSWREENELKNGHIHTNKLAGEGEGKGGKGPKWAVFEIIKYNFLKKGNI